MTGLLPPAISTLDDQAEGAYIQYQRLPDALSKNIYLTALHDHLARQLPEYARPVFLRIRQDNDVTTTFKQKKVDLVKDGFDPSRTGDPIYFSDPQRKAFVRLDGALFADINAGRIRL